jgi:dihydroneopterin aldolase
MRAMVEIAGLALFAHHGVSEAEQQTGQRFVLDLALELDAAEAIRHDDIKATVDYGEVVAVAESAFVARRYNLIETAAAQVASAILAHFPRVVIARVTVHKPSAPVPAIIDHVAATIERRRNG